MSRTAYSSLPGGERCPSASETDKQAALQSLVRCSNLSPSASLLRQSQNINQISRQVIATQSNEQNSQDMFFRVLAQENQAELVCAQKFAQDLIKDSASVELIADRFRALREAKQQVIHWSSQLESPHLVGARHCPSSPEELTPNPNTLAMLGEDKHYEICRELLKSRAAVTLLEGSIPLMGVREVGNLMDEYSTAKEFNGNLSARIVQAYTAAIQKTQEDERKISQILQTQGAAGFNRADRRALMSDSLLVEKIIKKGGNSDSLRAAACYADASYGYGATKLDNALLVGSFLFSGGAGVVGKITLHGSKVAAGLNEARYLGYLSYNSAHSLKTAALFSLGSAAAANTYVKAYENVNKACFNTSSLNSQNAGGMCVGTPKLHDLPRENCVIAASLSTLSVVLPGTLTTMALQKAGQEKILSALEKSRTVTTRIKTTRKETALIIDRSDVQHISSQNWSLSRHANKTPLEYQRDLQIRAARLNALYRQKEQSRNSNPALDQELQQAITDFRKIAPHSEGTYLYSDQKIEEILETLPESVLTPLDSSGRSNQSLLEHYGPKGLSRFKITYCEELYGCVRGQEIIVQGRLLSFEPQCGPEVFKIHMSANEILDMIKNNRFNQERVAGTELCQ